MNERCFTVDCVKDDKDKKFGVYQSTVQEEGALWYGLVGTELPQSEPTDMIIFGNSGTLD